MKKKKRFASETPCDERQRNMCASVQTATAVQTPSDRLLPWRLYKVFVKDLVKWKRDSKDFVSVYVVHSPTM